MKRRKLTALTSLCLALCLLGSSWVFAEETGDETGIDNVILDQILEQALEVDDNYSLEDKENFSVIKSDPTPEAAVAMTAMNLSNNDASEYSIQSTEELEDGMIAVTTITPYHIMEDGSLMNSFEYAESVSRELDPNKDWISYIVDVTVTGRAYYTQYSYYYGAGPHYYRHVGVEGSWSSSKSLKMTYLFIKFESCGELHEYPKCIQYEDPAKSFLGNKNYRQVSSIGQTNAVKGRIYADANHMMPENRCLYLSEDYSLGHGGLVYIKVSYTIDGNQKIYDSSNRVYWK